MPAATWKLNDAAYARRTCYLVSDLEEAEAGEVNPDRKMGIDDKVLSYSAFGILISFIYGIYGNQKN